MSTNKKQQSNYRDDGVVVDFILDGFAWYWSNGYIIKWERGKTKRQHRYILEKHLKRPLLKSEHVHHINGIRHDNRIENLKIVTNSEHTIIHNIGNNYTKGKKFKLSDKEIERRRNYAIYLRKNNPKFSKGHTGFPSAKGKDNKLSKPVFQSNMQGEIIKEWESINDAAREGGFCASHISRAANGYLKHHKGFKWSFKH